MTAGIKANVDGSGAIQVGGTDYITIGTTGNVGIGTTSPTGLLDVFSSSTGVIRSRGGSVTGYMFGSSAGGLAAVGTETNHPFSVYVNGTEQGRFDTSGNFQFNSGYGSVATAYGCRAWVNFNGTAAGTFAGGTSTVTRIAGSTTATVTTTTAHGLLTGSVVYALTGVAAGTYTVTFISATQFSFTTVATTALTAASITFAVNSIRASGNVSSVADNATGDYTVNFATAMPDANYSFVVTSQVAAGAASRNNLPNAEPITTLTARIRIVSAADGALTDQAFVLAAIFR
jgi:hypothetical protein